MVFSSPHVFCSLLPFAVGHMGLVMFDEHVIGCSVARTMALQTLTEVGLEASQDLTP